MLDVLSRFRENAAQQPMATALLAGSAVTTFDELDRASASIAAVLLEHGVGEEDLVGLLLDRREDWPAAILGVWKSGAAFVPLNEADPEPRLAALLADCDPRLIIAGDRARTRIPPIHDTVRFHDLLTQSVPSPLSSPRLHDNQLAYAIYTSGSTGAPKAVLVEHHGLTSFARWMAEGPLRLSPADRVLQWATPSVDAYIADLLMGPVCGATLVLPSADGDLDDLGHLMARTGVTVATLTPTLWRYVPDAAFEHLRAAISAGEACPPEVASRLSLHSTFINAYGPTEATICATVALRPGDGVTIGRALPGVTALLDPDSNELLIGGGGVARGYLGRPALTAERFLPDPKSPNPGARLYRSGDRCRVGDTGELEYVGRLDNQVKVRGFRIEVGEVECALREHSVVDDAAVTAPNTARGTELVGFVTLVSGQDVDSELLRSDLRRQLPEHMVPARIHVVTALPTTAWGKLDRTALSEPESATETPALSQDHGTAGEILSVWQRILADDRVAIDQDFFDAGGNSLLALRVVGELRRSLAPSLTIRDLFDHPTPVQLAALFDSPQFRARG